MGETRMCAFEISDIGDYELQEAETIITTWVAEHTEPVYPSWWEWLAAGGLDPDDPIPADIAQKLGIEPKEGQHERN
jgi:hypothetical protein